MPRPDPRRRRERRLQTCGEALEHRRRGAAAGYDPTSAADPNSNGTDETDAFCADRCWNHWKLCFWHFTPGGLEEKCCRRTRAFGSLPDGRLEEATRRQTRRSEESKPAPHERSERTGRRTELVVFGRGKHHHQCWRCCDSQRCDSRRAWLEEQRQAVGLRYYNYTRDFNNFWDTHGRAAPEPKVTPPPTPDVDGGAADTEMPVAVAEEDPEPTPPVDDQPPAPVASKERPKMPRDLRVGLAAAQTASASGGAEVVRIGAS